jgi:hypothetical protein
MNSLGLSIAYDITPDLVHRVVQIPGPGLQGINAKKHDVYMAADVPQLSGFFNRLTDSGVSLHDLAVVVKTPKAVRKARRKMMLAMGL